MANTSIKATIQSTSNPIVTKIIKNQSAVNDLSGISIDYEATANGYVLAYDASSNNFTPVTVTSALGASGIDGGVVE